MKAARVSEKVEQQHIVQLLVSIGGRVKIIGTRRPRGKACPKCGTFVPEHQGTCQTPGISDLEAFLPPAPRSALSLGLLIKIECKANGGQQSDEQKAYQAECVAAGIPYIVGGLDAVIAWLCEAGYVRADQFPYYRQPGAAAR